MGLVTYREALRQAIEEEMALDERVMIMGEEVGRYGGAYAVTKGLLERFGADRVRDTPISEAAITGVGVGAAILGMRPIVELMYVDFVALAMDQIATQAAKLRYMTGGQLHVPMVLRTQGGTGRSAGAQHSQSLEAWLVHIPGLRVVMPATPSDAKGLLKTAIRSEDPVVFIEHKALYALKGELPDSCDHRVPFGKARLARSGNDITIVAYSRMVHTSLEAAEILEKSGYSVEVIDLRTLNPLDIECVAESVRRTRAAIVVTEAHRNMGMSAEISSRIWNECWTILNAPVGRIGGEDVPVPASHLERWAIPSADIIVEKVKETLEKGRGK